MKTGRGKNRNRRNWRTRRTFRKMPEVWYQFSLVVLSNKFLLSFRPNIKLPQVLFMSSHGFQVYLHSFSSNKSSSSSRPSVQCCISRPNLHLFPLSFQLSFMFSSLYMYIFFSFTNIHLYVSFTFILFSLFLLLQGKCHMYYSLLGRP